MHSNQNGMINNSASYGTIMQGNYHNPRVEMSQPSNSRIVHPPNPGNDFLSMLNIAPIYYYLRMIHDGQLARHFGIAYPMLTIGRDPASDLTIRLPTVSRKHALIQVDKENRPWLENLGRTVTTVNGQMVPQGNRVRLYHGDRIGFSTQLFQVEFPPFRTDCMRPSLPKQPEPRPAISLIDHTVPEPVFIAPPYSHQPHQLDGQQQRQPSREQHSDQSASLKAIPPSDKQYRQSSTVEQPKPQLHHPQHPQQQQQQQHRSQSSQQPDATNADHQQQHQQHHQQQQHSTARTTTTYARQPPTQQHRKSDTLVQRAADDSSHSTTPPPPTRYAAAQESSRTNQLQQSRQVSASNTPSAPDAPDVPIDGQQQRIETTRRITSSQNQQQQQQQQQEQQQQKQQQQQSIAQTHELMTGNPPPTSQNTQPPAAKPKAAIKKPLQQQHRYSLPAKLAPRKASRLSVTFDETVSYLSDREEGSGGEGEAGLLNSSQDLDDDEMYPVSSTSHFVPPMSPPPPTRVDPKNATTLKALENQFLDKLAGKSAAAAVPTAEAGSSAAAEQPKKASGEITAPHHILPNPSDIQPLPPLPSQSLSLNNTASVTTSQQDDSKHGDSTQAVEAIPESASGTPNAQDSLVEGYGDESIPHNVLSCATPSVQPHLDPENESQQADPSSQEGTGEVGQKDIATDASNAQSPTTAEHSVSNILSKQKDAHVTQEPSLQSLAVSEDQGSFPKSTTPMSHEEGLSPVALREERHDNAEHASAMTDAALTSTSQDTESQGSTSLAQTSEASPVLPEDLDGEALPTDGGDMEDDLSSQTPQDAPSPTVHEATIDESMADVPLVETEMTDDPVDRDHQQEQQEEDTGLESTHQDSPLDAQDNSSPDAQTSHGIEDMNMDDSEASQDHPSDADTDAGADAADPELEIDDLISTILQTTSDFDESQDSQQAEPSDSRAITTNDHPEVESDTKGQQSIDQIDALNIQDNDVSNTSVDVTSEDMKQDEQLLDPVAVAKPESMPLVAASPSLTAPLSPLAGTVNAEDSLDDNNANGDEVDGDNDGEDTHTPDDSIGTMDTSSEHNDDDDDDMPNLTPVALDDIFSVSSDAEDKENPPGGDSPVFPSPLHAALEIISAHAHYVRTLPVTIQSNVQVQDATDDTGFDALPPFDLDDLGDDGCDAEQSHANIPEQTSPLASIVQLSPIASARKHEDRIHLKEERLPVGEDEVDRDVPHASTSPASSPPALKLDREGVMDDNDDVDTNVHEDDENNDSDIIPSTHPDHLDDDDIIPSTYPDSGDVHEDGEHNGLVEEVIDNDDDDDYHLELPDDLPDDNGKEVIETEEVVPHDVLLDELMGPLWSLASTHARDNAVNPMIQLLFTPSDRLDIHQRQTQYDLITLLRSIPVDLSSTINALQTNLIPAPPASEASAPPQPQESLEPHCSPKTAEVVGDDNSQHHQDTHPGTQSTSDAPVIISAFDSVLLVAELESHFTSLHHQASIDAAVNESPLDTVGSDDGDGDEDAKTSTSPSQYHHSTDSPRSQSPQTRSQEVTTPSSPTLGGNNMDDDNDTAADSGDGNGDDNNTPQTPTPASTTTPDTTMQAISPMSPSGFISPASNSQHHRQSTALTDISISIGTASLMSKTKSRSSSSSIASAISVHDVLQYMVTKKQQRHSLDMVEITKAAGTVSTPTRYTFTPKKQQHPAAGPSTPSALASPHQQTTTTPRRFYFLHKDKDVSPTSSSSSPISKSLGDHMADDNEADDVHDHVDNDPNPEQSNLNTTPAFDLEQDEEDLNFLQGITVDLNREFAALNKWRASKREEIRHSLGSILDHHGSPEDTTATLKHASFDWMHNSVTELDPDQRDDNPSQPSTENRSSKQREYDPHSRTHPQQSPASKQPMTTHRANLPSNILRNPSRQAPPRAASPYRQQSSHMSPHRQTPQGQKTPPTSLLRVKRALLETPTSTRRAQTVYQPSTPGSRMQQLKGGMLGQPQRNDMTRSTIRPSHILGPPQRTTPQSVRQRNPGTVSRQRAPPTSRFPQTPTPRQTPAQHTRGSASARREPGPGARSALTNHHIASHLQTPAPHTSRKPGFPSSRQPSSHLQTSYNPSSVRRQPIGSQTAPRPGTTQRGVPASTSRSRYIPPQSVVKPRKSLAQTSQSTTEPMPDVFQRLYAPTIKKLNIVDEDFEHRRALTPRKSHMPTPIGQRMKSTSAAATPIAPTPRQQQPPPPSKPRAVGSHFRQSSLAQRQHLLTPIIPETTRARDGSAVQRPTTRPTPSRITAETSCALTEEHIEQGLRRYHRLSLISQASGAATTTGENKPATSTVGNTPQKDDQYTSAHSPAGSPLLASLVKLAGASTHHSALASTPALVLSQALRDNLFESLVLKECYGLESVQEEHADEALSDTLSPRRISTSSPATNTQKVDGVEESGEHSSDSVDHTPDTVMDDSYTTQSTMKDEPVPSNDAVLSDPEETNNHNDSQESGDDNDSDDQDDDDDDDDSTSTHQQGSHEDDSSDNDNDHGPAGRPQPLPVIKKSPHTPRRSPRIRASTTVESRHTDLDPDFGLTTSLVDVDTPLRRSPRLSARKRPRQTNHNVDNESFTLVNNTDNATNPIATPNPPSRAAKMKEEPQSLGRRKSPRLLAYSRAMESSPEVQFP